MVGVAGCGASAPSAAPSPVPRIVSGVAYAPAQPAESSGHLLDLYLPADTSKPVPVIIWSEGNGWLDDNGYADAGQVATWFNPHGYAVAGVGIRSARQATFPAQLSDIKAAIRFLRDNAGHYRLDGNHIGVMGDSSGGWAAAMAAVTGDEPALDGDVGVRGPSSRVQAAVVFYPPTDFAQLDRDMLGDCVPFNQQFGLTGCASDPHSSFSQLLGCPVQTCPDRAAADPIRYVSRDDPPMLLVHGQQDVAVPWQQSLLLYQAVQRASGDATLVLVPHGQHGQAFAFLTDPAVNADALAQTTDNGTQQPAAPVQLSVAYLLSFFDRYLR
ncbi:MAG: prolyl oligopeptidase family serine peptidase [Blastococcus sp.]